MNIEDVTYQMNLIAGDVSKRLGISPGLTKILLHREFKWNSEQLIKQYSKSKDIQQFLKKYRISSSKTKHLRRSCKICLETTKCIELSACGHLYCKTCWKFYIENEIEDEQNWLIICPTQNCDAILTEEVILSMNPEISKSLMALQTNSFIGNSSLFNSCPAPNCSRIVLSKITTKKSKFSPSTSITCLCGMEFCPDCQQESHEPVPCKLLKEWTQKSGKNSHLILTEKWLNSNSKKCPKCRHMTCRNKNCRYEFCWVCMKNWAGGHISYNCPYEKLTRISNTIVRLRKNANNDELYQHYLARFLNCSIKLEVEYNNELERKLQQKVNQMMNVNEEFVEILHEAVQALKKSNKTLAYSCIFAFYIAQENTSCLRKFEKAVKDLRIIAEGFDEIFNLTMINYADWINLVKLKTRLAKEACAKVSMIPEINSSVFSWKMFGRISICSALIITFFRVLL